MINRALKEQMIANNQIYKIHKLTPAIGGLRVQLQEKDGNIFTIKTEFGSEIVDMVKFEKWVELKLL